VEYKNEGRRLFDGLLQNIDNSIVEMLLKAELRRTEPQKRIIIQEKTKKVGRNDPCPCGSGLKYKKCCGK